MEGIVQISKTEGNINYEQKQRRDVFYQKSVLKNFAICTWKKVSFIIKLQSFRLGTLLNRDVNTGVFLWIWNFWGHLIWRPSASDCFCTKWVNKFLSRFLTSFNDVILSNIRTRGNTSNKIKQRNKLKTLFQI